MKINSIHPSELLYQYTSIQNKQATSGVSTMRSDQVELTSDARTFSAAMKKAKEELDAGGVSPARIHELRTQIQNGTYDVPGYLVVNKILGE